MMIKIRAMKRADLSIPDHSAGESIARIYDYRPIQMLPPVQKKRNVAKNNNHGKIFQELFTLVLSDEYNNRWCFYNETINVF